MSHKKKNKDKVLIIDGNNALYRAYYKYSSMKAQSGDKTGIIFGFTYILRGLIEKLKPRFVYVVFDGGRSKHRIEVNPDYKKRDKKEGFDKDDFYKQRDVTLEILKCLGIQYIMNKGEEADDLIWLLARKLKRKQHVIIVSSDKDFNQAISANVTIWNPHKKLMYTEDNLKQIMGYEPKECVDYLILDGDKSDHILGMPGVGPKTALKFIAEHGSIYNFLDNPGLKFKKWDRGLLEQVYLDNRIQIDLRLYARKFLTKKDLVIRNTNINNINLKELSYICSDYSIRTFTKPPFLKTFKNLLQ